MLYDSHAHLNNEGYSREERQEVIGRIQEAVDGGLLSYVNDIGFDLASSKMAVDHSEGYPWCYGAVGYHPHCAKDMGEMELLMIRSLAGKKNIKAIGEIGLDFHYDHSPRDVQRECFIKQVELAKELEMPIVIHSREADGQVMDILKGTGAFSEERKSLFPERPVPEGWESAAGDARVLLHCFSGSRELGEQYVRLGATLSMAGPLTYKNNKKTVEVARNIPLEFLMVETDSPYLTPEPRRGEKNISINVKYTAQRLAVLCGRSFEETAEITCMNAKRFFDIP